MLRNCLAVFFASALGLSLAAADDPASKTQLSAAETVNKNAEARGGLQAWRAVQTLTLSGTMGIGGNQRVTLAVPPHAGQTNMTLPPPRPKK